MQQGVDCLDDGTHIGFRASSADPRLAGLLGQLFGQMNGNHQNRNLRKKSGDLPGDVESVQIGHLKVQQDHVRRILFHPLKRFFSGASFVANLPGALLLEESPQIMPDRRVVVDYKNSNQAALPLGPKSFRTGTPNTHPPASKRKISVSFAMTFCLVLFQHGPRSYFLDSVPVAPGPFCTFLDMFVFALFLRAHTPKCFFPGTAPLS